MLGWMHQAGSLLATNIDTFALKGLLLFPHAVDTIIISMQRSNMLQKGPPSRSLPALKPRALNCR